MLVTETRTLERVGLRGRGREKDGGRGHFIPHVKRLRPQVGFGAEFETWQTWVHSYRSGFSWGFLPCRERVLVALSARAKAAEHPPLQRPAARETAAAPCEEHGFDGLLNGWACARVVRRLRPLLSAPGTHPVVKTGLRLHRTWLASTSPWRRPA